MSEEAVAGKIGVEEKHDMRPNSKFFILTVPSHQKGDQFAQPVRRNSRRSRLRLNFPSIHHAVRAGDEPKQLHKPG